jgi:hypothetical protein
MAITLAALPVGSIWKQALVLAVVAIGITVAVYGVVALIVKADDVGLALARGSATGAGRATGRGIVRGMPVLLKILSVIGTAAMICTVSRSTVRPPYLMPSTPRRRLWLICSRRLQRSSNGRSKRPYPASSAFWSAPRRYLSSDLFSHLYGDR